MGLKKTLYYARWYYLKAIRKLTKKPIPDSKYYPAKKRMTDIDAQNEYIYNLLMSGKPCMVARYGATETRAILQYEHKGCISFKKELALQRMCRSSGFFPKDGKLLYRFAEMMEDCSSELDFIALWYVMQDYLVDTYAPKARVGTLGGLESWWSDVPWSRALAGKRVVVVHPFSNTIAAQYKNYDKLFENKEVLPLFQLRCVRTPVTLNEGELVEADGCKDWFEALERIYAEVMQEDFDVAIIGCGAYGFPLAAQIKRAGKQAVHMGGASQLLFGIMGKRWETMSVTQMANEYWTYPLPEDSPENGKLVENGCYWK